MTRRRGYCYLVRPMRKGSTRARYKIRLQHAPRITAARFPNPWRIKELAEMALAARYAQPAESLFLENVALVFAVRNA